MSTQPLKFPLAQRSLPWGPMFLGASQLTVGRYGCTTTAICNGLHYFGITITPDQFARNPDNYTKPGHPQGAGLVDWQKFKLPGGFKFIRRIGSRTNPVRDDRAIQAALKDPNQFVILEVDNGQHWVLAIGRAVLTNDYRIDDSWYGDKRTACGTYHNITGCAIFGR